MNVRDFVIPVSSHAHAIDRQEDPMWVVPSKPACYGRMFPETRGGLRAGVVFGVRRDISTDKPALEFNPDQWDRCQECHYYRHCFDRGLAEAALLSAQAPDFRC